VRFPSEGRRPAQRYRVEPRYSELAQRHRIEGTVRFEILIGKDGRVEALRTISGHPLLVNSAYKAVKRWVYRPVLFRGEPARVITTVAVPFRLPPPQEDEPVYRSA
jgi:TonB family protein